MEARRTLRVVVIGSPALDSGAWRHDRASFAVGRVASLDEALQRVRDEGADVVVAPPDPAGVNGRPSGRPPGWPAGTPLLVLDPDADPAVQAELLVLTAERARLERELASRSGALRQTEDRFRDVIERNADAIIVVDRDGMIRFANAMAERLFGRPRQELVSTAFGFPMVAGETTELDLHREDGARVVEMRVVESEWEGRDACIASLRDVTERKQAEADARSLIRAEAARAAAEAAARRFRFLAESSTVLSSSLDYRTTLAELARLCVAEIADWAVVYVVEEGDTVRRLEVAHRDASKQRLARELREWPIRPDGPHPVLDVLRTRRPLLVTDIDDGRLAAMAGDPRHLQLMRELGVASFMMVPLAARDRSLGAIALVSAEPGRTFTDNDVELAADLALRAGLAVDNARLYSQAREVNQAKSDLFAAISHDLRTPLNSIIGHADLLSMGLPDPLSEAGRERVDRIRTSASHLLHLINELLTLVQLDAGRQKLRLTDIRVGAVTNDVRDVVELLAGERNLAFRVDCRDPDLVLRTDPDKLRQVLLNLIGNAIRYTEQGEVRLDVRQQDDTIAFRVCDTGVGIQPEDLSRIFEPFWQADTARCTDRDGTGLGLSIVQRLVRLLGGDVRAESVPGEGSTFTVILPLTLDPSHDAPAPSAAVADAEGPPRVGRVRATS